MFYFKLIFFILIISLSFVQSDFRTNSKWKKISSDLKLKFINEQAEARALVSNFNK